MRLLPIFLLLPFLSLAQAQVQDPGAEAILKRVSARYTSLKSYKASYTRQAENAAGKPTEKVAGQLVVQGERFYLKAGAYQIFTDGKTLYTYQPSSGEVNATIYDPAEEEMSPTQIGNLYKKGYKYVLLSEAKARDGHTVQTVDLEPEDITKEIVRIRLIIDKATAQIRKYIIYERGTGARQVITINTFLPNAPVDKALFAYTKARFPKAKLVDLR